MREYIIEEEFEVDGYKCVIIGSVLGHRCGYIGLPVGHPLYGKDYSDIDINIHGGLTYSNHGSHTPYSKDKDMWWVGFDCAHCMDARDMKLIKLLADETYYKHIEKMEEMFPTGGTVRTLEYVEKELINGVRQLKRVESDEKQQNV